MRKVYIYIASVFLVLLILWHVKSNTREYLNLSKKEEKIIKKMRQLIQKNQKNPVKIDVTKTQEYIDYIDLENKYKQNNVPQTTATQQQGWSHSENVPENVPENVVIKEKPKPNPKEAKYQQQLYSDKKFFSNPKKVPSPKEAKYQQQFF